MRTLHLEKLAAIRVKECKEATNCQNQVHRRAAKIAERGFFDPIPQKAGRRLDHKLNRFEKKIETS